jgi:hypothetical protein
MDSTDIASESKARGLVMSKRDAGDLAALLIAVARPRTPAEQQQVDYWVRRLQKAAR